VRRMVISEIDYSARFLEALHSLQKSYKKFPKFMIEIIAENHGIPPSEVKKLFNIYRRNGILKILKNEGFYYQLNES
jgi:DNA-binding IscR family transcriptional regulator